MNTITIPRVFAQKDDLVVMPRKEYEALIELKKTQEFTPTAAQKRALVQARRNFKADKTLSFDELTRRLGSRN